MPPHRRGGGDRQGVKKGAWSPEEDEVLRQHVREHGEKDWSSIQSKGLLDRTGKSCRLRWVNKLHPDLKSGKFSPEEERVVLDLQAQFGNRWAMIATHLQGRTDNDVKNFWSSRQKRLARLLQELPPRKRDVRKSGSSSHDLLVQQEPSSSMITLQAMTYDIGQNSSQDTHEVKLCIDAPLTGVLHLPAPVNTAMEIEPGSSSIVPFSTYAQNPVPGVGADLASLHYAISQTRNTYAAPSHEFHAQQEPTSSMITFQATTYDTDQNRSQEPQEVKHWSNTPLPEVIYLQTPGKHIVHAAMELGSSSTTVPFCKTYPKSHVPGTRADLASLHYATFIEPVAVVSAALSFGSAPFYDSPNNEPHPPQVIPSDPFLEDQYFAIAALHRNMSEMRFNDLTLEVLDFFSQP